MSTQVIRTEDTVAKNRRSVAETENEAGSSTTRGVADNGSLASSKDTASIPIIDRGSVVVNTGNQNGGNENVENAGAGDSAEGSAAGKRCAADQRAQHGTKNTVEEDGVRYSVHENIVDINGKQYDSVVELDKSVSKGTLADPRRNDL